MSDNTPSLNRRRLLGATGAVGLAAGAGALGFPQTAQADNAQGDRRPVAKRGGVARTSLRFRNDGSFTILQFNDTQDTQLTDKRTLELITKAVRTERPDLVILVGDNINGTPATALEHKQAMNNVAATVEATGTPWLATFGNHDEDSTPKSGIDEAAMLAFYRQYRHNVNVDGARGITGTGNMYLPILAPRGRRSAYGIWLLDSGRYAPEKIAGQDFEGYPDWDWLRMDQVDWYYRLSQELEQDNRRVVPSSMFFHIALWEHRFMWFSSVDDRSAAAHQRAVAKHGITGERNEDECPGPFNSGMFNALLKRGETRSVSVGHDHINTYWGNYYGIQLGYGPGSGFGAYGLGGAQNHRLRGGRVFKLQMGSNGLAELDRTYPVYAKDLGIDITAGNQRIPAPLPFPRGVR
ncbi:metallophosphoesterase family protein [Nigerium massiliense]|uniref:metallophosphoesterase family protein n=1 Tax=Nigerium massiliense TaxID=1522317 RepID=UPI00058D9AC6|nr:metallophosphoesterase family protein [Nigerium massiliense]